MCITVPYFLSLVDNSGFTHSIDMIHLYGYGNYPDFVPLCEKFNIEYTFGTTNRGNKYMSVYEYFNFDTVGLNKCVTVGRGQRHDSYDDDSEKWTIKPSVPESALFWDLRFNPNKISSRSWWLDFVALIRSWEKDNPGNLYIHKFDYAVDVPDTLPHEVFVKTLKKTGRVDDTFYFGRSGKSGYLKIYNKSKELEINDKNITRFEYTFNAAEPRRFDVCYIGRKTDASDLVDTDQAIIAMYNILLTNHEYDFDLKRWLGRRKYAKLEPYLHAPVQVNFDKLDLLLKSYCELFNAQLDKTSDELLSISELTALITHDI